MVIADEASNAVAERINGDLGKIEVIAGRTRITDSNSSKEDKLVILNEEVKRNRGCFYAGGFNIRGNIKLI